MQSLMSVSLQSITTLFTKMEVKSHLCVMRLRDMLQQNGGATAIEYALIGVAMATLLAAVLGNSDNANSLLGSLKVSFDNIRAAITSVTTAASGKPTP